MAQANPYTDGLFNFNSAQDILRAKANARAANSLSLAEAVKANTPADRTAGMLGALVGSALGNKLAPPTLTDEERQSTDAVSAAKARTDAWKAANPDASAEDLGLTSMKHMSEELLGHGNYQQGIPLAQAYIQQVQAKKIGDLQAEKLGYEVDTEKNTRDFWNVKNVMKDVLIKGEQEPRHVFVDAQGNATYQDEATGQMKQVPLGGWHDAPTVHINQNGSSGKVNPLFYGWTPKQIGDVRDLGATIPDTVNSYIRLHKALAQDVAANGSVNMLGKNGEIQGGISDFTNAVTGLARMAGSFFGVGDNYQQLQTPGQALEWAKAHPDLVNDMKVQMPENIRKSTEASARWTAAAAQLAFSRHQSLEPGNRGMSDKDFATEVKMIGAQTSDPEAFRQLSIDNFNQQLEKFQFKFASAPEEIQNMIFDPKGPSRGKIDESIGKFNDLYKSGPWGSAANPKGSLVPGAEPNRIPTYNPATGKVE